MSHINWIKAALINLDMKEFSNYFMSVKKYKVIYITLMRQFTGKTVLNYKANAESK